MLSPHFRTALILPRRAGNIITMWRQWPRINMTYRLMPSQRNVPRRVVHYTGVGKLM